MRESHKKLLERLEKRDVDDLEPDELRMLEYLKKGKAEGEKETASIDHVAGDGRTPGIDVYVPRCGKCGCAKIDTRSTPKQMVYTCTECRARWFGPARVAAPVVATSAGPYYNPSAPAGAVIETVGSERFRDPGKVHTHDE